MTTDREPFARYRELLEGLGFRPSRRLGQNFLLEPALHRAVADAAEVRSGDLVLEPGAGLGFLTRELLARTAPVVAVEIDPRLLRVLRAELARIPGGERVRVVEGSVLERDALAPAVEREIRAGRPAARRFVVAANLPYAISGPFLAAVVTAETPPDAQGLLVQREFADRLTARPGSEAFGGPSVLAQAAWHARRLRAVPAEVFRPRPKVGSAIVALTARAGGLLALPRSERQGFAAFVRALFAERRKTLRHGLVRAGRDLGARFAADRPERRAEQLEADELLAIWTARRPGSEAPDPPDA